MGSHEEEAGADTGEIFWLRLFFFLCHSGGCGRWDVDCIWCVCSKVSSYPLSGAVIQLVRMQEGWFEMEVSFWTHMPVCDFIIVEVDIEHG